jgi:hypothetical protein
MVSLNSGGHSEEKRGTKMKSNWKVTVALLGILLTTSGALAKKHPPSTSCRAYFVVAEKDRITVNLTMVGLNGKQEKWYEQHGGEFPGLCLVNGNASGKRVTLDSLTSSDYLDSIVGTSPLYMIGWEEHLVFVPDDNGGHHAYSANGILSRWDKDKQDFIPIGPAHNTNRTIFSSASASLLKDGLKEIEGY